MSFWKGKNVLVTGGAGFIGSNIVENLHKESNVTVVVRNTRDNKIEANLMSKHGVKIIEADLLKKSSMKNMLDNIDYVFALAAIVGGAEYNNAHPASILRDNTSMTINLLDALRESGVKRTLIVSSSNVYPPAIDKPLKESMAYSGDLDRSRFGYGWSKRFAEILARTYCAEFGLKIGIARPFIVYGPHSVFEYEMAAIIPRIILNLEEGTPITLFGNGNQTRNFVYVSDVVEAMKLIVEKYPEPDPINIGSDEEVSLNHLVGTISGLMHIKPIVKFEGVNTEGKRRVCDITKAKKLLGFTPRVKLGEGLKKTMDWYYETKKGHGIAQK